MNQGLQINIVFEDGEFLSTSYNGYPMMFSPTGLPSFVKEIKMSKNCITVSINRADTNNLLTYIREHGTSIVKTL